MAFGEARNSMKAFAAPGSFAFDCATLAREGGRKRPVSWPLVANVQQVMSGERAIKRLRPTRCR
jgi:hypothetical protein